MAGFGPVRLGDGCESGDFVTGRWGMSSGRDPRGAGPLLALAPALPELPELGLQRLARRLLFL